MKVSTTWNIGGKSGTTWERLGEAILPSPFTARFSFPDDHTVDLEIRVQNGAPVCEEIHILRNPSRPSLDGAEIRRMPLRDWVTYAVGLAAMTHRESGYQGTHKLEPASPDETERIIGEARRRFRRNTITDDLLRDVARVYRANQESKPRDAVADTFQVAPSTATRYLKLARERGFLRPAPGPGKAGEQ